jgi:Protein of unknown function (DUF3800)
VLTAYIDESGHAADPSCRFVGLGGLVALTENWQIFEQKWRTALDLLCEGEPFHMNLFAAREGVFKGWSEEKRRKLLAALIDAIFAANAIPTGCVISLDDFEALPIAAQEFFVEPYYMAFQEATKGACLQAMPYAPPFSDSNGRVSMVYAYQSEYGAVHDGKEYRAENAGKADSLWHAMKDKTVYGTWMGTYRTAKPVECPPLQAGDLFIYELVKEFENRLRRPNDQMRWALRKLLPLAGHKPLIKLHTIETMTQTLIDCGALKPDADTSSTIGIHASFQGLATREDLLSRRNFWQPS